MKFPQFYQKCIALVLVIIISITMFPSCSVASNDILKSGEFYALFMEEAGLYYISNAPDENMPGYEVEAQAMVDWGLLDEDKAFDNLYGKVNKETVLTVCLNNMYFVKEGSIESFKDAKFCDNPKLMANAVATGIAELTNGYLEANKKMTREQCLEIIHKSLEIDLNTHFEDGSGTVEYNYGNDYTVFTADDLNPDEITIVDYTPEDYVAESMDENKENLLNDCNLNKTTVFAQRQIYVPNIENDAALTDSDSNRKNETFTIILPKDALIWKAKKPIIGEKYIYMPWNGSKTQDLTKYDNSESLKNGFAGKLVSYKDEYLTYECVFEYLDDKEIINGMEIKKYGKDIKKDGLSKPIFQKEIEGFSISFNKTNNGYEVTANKTFEYSENKYNNWRDREIKPTLTVSASIYDFHFDCDNVKGLISNSKSDKTLMGLSYKTNQTFKLETGELRLAPDSNRNGKYFSNFSNSRFTSGAGAKYVKIGGTSIKIPSIGLEIPINVYLEIKVDGTVEIVFDESKDIRLVRQNGNLKLDSEQEKNKEQNITGNIDAGIRLEVGAKFILMRKRLFVLYAKLGVNITVRSSLYENSKLLYNGYIEADVLKEGCALDKKYNYCLDISLKSYFEFGVCEGASYGSFLADILKDKIDDLKYRKESDSILLHLEDGLSFKSSKVEKCTRNDALDVNKEGKIELKTYKENMNADEQISISIMSIPLKADKIESNGGIHVKSKDPNIAKVDFDSSLNVLNIYAVSEGSTEIEISILKKEKTNKKKAQYYKQEVSITVNPDVAVL